MNNFNFKNDEDSIKFNDNENNINIITKIIHELDF